MNGYERFYVRSARISIIRLISSSGTFPNDKTVERKFFISLVRSKLILIFKRVGKKKISDGYESPSQVAS